MTSFARQVDAAGPIGVVPRGRKAILRDLAAAESDIVYNTGDRVRTLASQGAAVIRAPSLRVLQPFDGEPASTAPASNIDLRWDLTTGTKHRGEIERMILEVTVVEAAGGFNAVVISPAAWFDYRLTTDEDNKELFVMSADEAWAVTALCEEQQVAADQTTDYQVLVNSVTVSSAVTYLIEVPLAFVSHFETGRTPRRTFLHTRFRNGGVLDGTDANALSLTRIRLLLHGHEQPDEISAIGHTDALSTMRVGVSRPYTHNVTQAVTIPVAGTVRVDIPLTAAQGIVQAIVVRARGTATPGPLSYWFGTRTTFDVLDSSLSSVLRAPYTGRELYFSKSVETSPSLLSSNFTALTSADTSRYDFLVCIPFCDDIRNALVEGALNGGLLVKDNRHWLRITLGTGDPTADDNKLPFGLGAITEAGPYTFSATTFVHRHIEQASDHSLSVVT